jgi:hypothetical protein
MDDAPLKSDHCDGRDVDVNGAAWQRVAPSVRMDDMIELCVELADAMVVAEAAASVAGEGQANALVGMTCHQVLADSAAPRRGAAPGRARR